MTTKNHVPQDSVSLPHWAVHIRHYSDGSTYAESADQSVRIRLHPWVQGEMGREEKR